MNTLIASIGFNSSEGAKIIVTVDRLGQTWIQIPIGSIEVEKNHSVELTITEASSGNPDVPMMLNVEQPNP
jgi:hypothetical protein